MIIVLSDFLAVLMFTSSIHGLTFNKTFITYQKKKKKMKQIEQKMGIFSQHKETLYMLKNGLKSTKPVQEPNLFE